jgi:tetratricopeptide (TPR) repeat protein
MEILTKSTRIRVTSAMMAFVVFGFFCERVLAQQYSIAADPDSQEGQFLELINLQSDQDKKLALIEQFTQRFPEHPGRLWAFSLLQATALQAGQWDKVLTFGEKVVQLNPDDMDAAQRNIKAAESKGDRVTAKLWSDYAQRLAQRYLESPPPEDPEQLEEWKRRTEIATKYEVQDEYALLKKAVDAGEAKQKVKLLDDLLKKNPDTIYLSEAQGIYLNAYLALGDKNMALVYAERILKADRNNEDALLTVADAYLQRGSSPEKVLGYSTKIIEVVNSKKRQTIEPDMDWERKMAGYIGTAHWMMGTTYVSQSRFALADAALRQALPLLRSSDQAAATILFHLGWVNYKLGHFKEAVRYYKQCMAYRSQYQQPAIKTLMAIKNEQGIEY